MNVRTIKFMKLLLEKNIVWWTIIIFFASVAALFYATRTRQKEDGNMVQVILPSPSPSISEQPAQKAPQKNSVKVMEDQGAHSTVRYMQGFSPREVTVKSETGCFVDIQNDGDMVLVPRLGPYDPKKEQGFLYPAIPAHKNSLIDPRYGTVPRLVFYDKNNPAEDFSVYIDPTCL